MKVKSLILSVLMLSVANAYAYDDWAWISRYANDNTELMNRADKKENLVVFLGNSITDGWPNSDKAFFDDNNFVGRGISGQTTYQFLVRFNDDVVNLAPAAVVINGGINDIAENNYQYSEDRTFGNIRAMAEIAQANGIKVILTSLLPADHIAWRPEITDAADKVISLNKRLQKLAADKGYVWVDYFAEMENGTTHGMKEEYTHDGVHPTDLGYRKMEEIVLPKIRAVLK